jgi:hypothetical protein
MTLTEYMKGDVLTEDLRIQVQYIYAFRMIMRMSQNNDGSLVIRKVNGRITVYSFYDVFPTKKSQRGEISEIIFNRWFECSEETIITISDRIAELIGVPGPPVLSGEILTPRAEDAMVAYDQFSEALDFLTPKISKVIERIDRDLDWYQSDIINLLIGKITP